MIVDMRISFFVECFIISLLCQEGASKSIERDGIIYEIEDDSTLCVIGVTNTDVNDLYLPDYIINVDKKCVIKSIRPGSFDKCNRMSTLSLPSFLSGLDFVTLKEVNLTDLYVNWDNLDSISFFISLEDSKMYDWVRDFADITLHVPKGLIDKYINAGYPWIGFNSITDGIDSIKQSFVLDGNIFNVSDHETKKVYAVFNGQKGRFVVPSNVISPIDSIQYNIIGIGARSFMGNNNLTEIVLPESISEICFEAFRDCHNLSIIKMSDSIKYIGIRAFYGCEKLRIERMPMALFAIGDQSFYNCKSINVIQMYDSVRTIGNYAFEGCEKLENIILNYGLTYIGRGCFKNCKALKSVLIPESIDFIETETFWGCINLKSATILWTSLKSLPEYFKLAFNLETMTELVVPSIIMDSITDEIIQNDFSSFRIITDGLRKTKEQAFVCDSIFYSVDDIAHKEVTARKILSTANKVIIPSVAKKDSTVFAVKRAIISMNNKRCDSLIISEGISVLYASIRNVDLKYLYLPSSIVDINVSYPLKLHNVGPVGSDCDIEYGWRDYLPENAFNGLLSLRSIILSENITKIGKKAFGQCRDLRTVIVKSSIPPLIDNELFDDSEIILYVPKGSIYKYKKSSGWQNASQIISFPKKRIFINRQILQAFSGNIN